MNFDNLENSNVAEFLEEINYFSEDGLLLWLQDHGLLARRRTCHKCTSNMSLQKKSGLLDKVVWRCNTNVSLNL